MIPDCTPGIDFSNVEFDQTFRPCDFVFPATSNFSHTKLSSKGDFSNAVFSNRADFEYADFGFAIFEGTKFFGLADFSGASFAMTSFQGARFFSAAAFEAAEFLLYATFEDASFLGEANFMDAIFRKRGVSFVNAEMKNKTTFAVAKFLHEPPEFFNAKMHEGTDWYRVAWPPPPTTSEQAERFVSAYERLKIEMDRLKKHEDELDFFARELQCRRVLHGNWKQISEQRLFGRVITVPLLNIPQKIIAPRYWNPFGRSVALPSFKLPARTMALCRPAPGLPIALYGLLCDYGRSYVRPLYGILVTVAIGTFLFWAHFGMNHLGQAAAISSANTFGALGFRKDFIDPKLMETLPGMLEMAAGLQTIAGTTLLFLVGLGLRNRFRMK